MNRRKETHVLELTLGFLLLGIAVYFISRK